VKETTLRDAFRLGAPRNESTSTGAGVSGVMGITPRRMPTQRMRRLKFN
jgi:hypothetical protein